MSGVDPPSLWEDSSLFMKWFGEGKLHVPATIIARIRRGKRVDIPPEWRGQVTHKQSQRKRPSHAPHKRRKELKYGRKRTPRPAERAALAAESEDFE